jgi:hypothetical protein
MLHDLARQLLPGPRQIAQFLDRLRRHKARPDQTMCQQIGDPGRIVSVALAAGHRLDVGRVGQDLLKATFQDVPDGLPVDTCGLHGHVSTPGLLEPIRKLHERPRRRRKSTHLVARLSPVGDPKACHYLRLVHVETRAPLV